MKKAKSNNRCTPFSTVPLPTKGLCLGRVHRFDEAEEMLRHMIDDPESGDFALDELAYIQQLREKDKTGGIDESNS